MDSGKQELKDILKVTTVGTAMYMLVGFIFNVEAFSFLFLGFFWLSSTVMTLVFRSTLRVFLKRVRMHGRNLRFVLIVGTNQKAYEFAKMIDTKKELGYSVIGFIDKNIHLQNGRFKLLGTLDDFSSIMKDHVIDEVVITLPVKSYYEEIKKVVEKAEEQGILIRYLSQIFDTHFARTRSENIDDFTVLTMSSGPQEGWQSITKRIIDLTVSVTLLFVAFPLLVLVSVIIKLTAPGPVFFSQDRIGFNKRRFRLIKFRTMVSDAEELQATLEKVNEMDGPVFKIKNDPRVTKFGRWLRKTSIDELPQLLNVLKGDMSLVGPRPLPVRDYSAFNVDWQRRRFSVLPGITCTWQVNGRNTISFEDWMKMDMEYIDNWKLSEDLKILFRTIPAVIKGKGAA
jgi:exopolysaccharide biosynthesis polyprenyl glycosylphosphotransferase